MNRENKPPKYGMRKLSIGLVSGILAFGMFLNVNDKNIFAGDSTNEYVSTQKENGVIEWTGVTGEQTRDTLVLSNFEYDGLLETEILGLQGSQVVKDGQTDWKVFNKNISSNYQNNTLTINGISKLPVETKIILRNTNSKELNGKLAKAYSWTVEDKSYEEIKKEESSITINQYLESKDNLYKSTKYDKNNLTDLSSYLDNKMYDFSKINKDNKTFGKITNRNKEYELSKVEGDTKFEFNLEGNLTKQVKLIYKEIKKVENLQNKDVPEQKYLKEEVKEKLEILRRDFSESYNEENRKLLEENNLGPYSAEINAKISLLGENLRRLDESFSEQSYISTMKDKISEFERELQIFKNKLAELKAKKDSNTQSNPNVEDLTPKAED